MEPLADAATTAFLDAAHADLQRQVGRSGRVEHLRAERWGVRTVLIATVRVGRRSIELRRSGESLVDAYGHLTRATAEPILAAAFRDYVTR